MAFDKRDRVRTRSPDLMALLALGGAGGVEGMRGSERREGSLSVKMTIHNSERKQL